ncbi:MAG: hypothetical protein ACRC0V_08530 [Fusobacteriaceae bacterium]
MRTNLFYNNYISELDSSYDCIILGVNNDEDIRKSNKVLEDLKKKFIKIKLFIIFDFDNLLDEKLNSNFLIIKDIKKDENDYRILIKENLEKLEIKTINIFLTGLERELILILVFLLEKWQYFISVTHITCDKYDYYEITTYEKVPQNLMFFSGNLQLSKPPALIILPGYEKEVVKIFVNYYEPSLLYIGNGSIDPLEKMQNLREDEIVQSLKEFYRNPEMIIKEFDYSPSDIDKTFEELKKLVVNLDNYNVILACCSTKLATISIYLFHKYYPNSQIVYLDAQRKITTNIMRSVITYKLNPIQNQK